MDFVDLLVDILMVHNYFFIGLVCSKMKMKQNKMTKKKKNKQKLAEIRIDLFLKKFRHLMSGPKDQERIDSFESCKRLAAYLLEHQYNIKSPWLS
jgi:F0F1-type ATP synthase membrane subunit a